MSGKGLTASIAIQNKIDQTADGTADPNFGGEVSVARCQTVAVECAPANAKNTSAFVVSPAQQRRDRNGLRRRASVSTSSSRSNSEQRRFDVAQALDIPTDVERRVVEEERLGRRTIA